MSRSNDPPGSSGEGATHRTCLCPLNKDMRRLVRQRVRHDHQTKVVKIGHPQGYKQVATRPGDQ